jgi:hypothetical protein
MIRISEDKFGILAICAIRYCQGRQTYMPDLVRSVVKNHLDAVEDNDLAVMIADCEFQEWANLYGDEKIDKPGWLKWRKTLLAEKVRREGVNE